MTLRETALVLPRAHYPGTQTQEVVPTAEQFDLVVIGGGPGGYASALYAAGIGMKVALVEGDKVGGTCLHRGCVPAKEFLETATVFRTVKRAAEFGVSADMPSVDFGTSQDRKQQVVGQLFKGLESLLRSRKITVVSGWANLLPDNMVRVDGHDAHGDAVIVASGSTPRTIPGFEPDGRVIVTSDEFLMSRSLPKRAAVIGGGAIGCEFASTLSDLGAEVTILEAMPKVLPGLDDDVAKLVVRSFEKRGIKVRTGVGVQSHQRSGDETTITMADGSTLTVDLVVVSVGRKPQTSTLGLEATQVQVDERGFIKVDQRMRTTVDGVWAVGDVVNTPQLAHVGFAEGIVAVQDILGEDPVPVDYSGVPWCIYCHPEVAFAGLSEAQAREAGHDVVVSKHRFIGNARALIVGEPDGLVKVIAERGPDGRAGRILGVHMVGPWVTEQIGQAYLAVNWEATADEVARFIQPHPTLSETFGETVMALTGRGLHG